MANNRTEFKTVVLNLIKAIVDITKHRQVLNDELADSINFRKDVKSSTIVATTAANNIDFTANDLVTINSATNNLDLTLTITNTVDGEDSKYIKVIKDVNKNVTFSSATDISTFDVRGETDVVYQVINKNGLLFVKALLGGRLTKEIEIGDWDMDTLLFVTIAHNLSDFKNARVSHAMIRNDADDAYYSIEAGGNMGRVDVTDIVVARDTGSVFDSTDFNATGYNRGWITIEYTL